MLSGSPATYTGGCHCGAVRFEVDVAHYVAQSCNCSICRKKGFIHLIVSRDRFRLIQGAEVLTSYRFNTGVANHQFCKHCGIHSFYTPRSHPDAVDVNVRCLDGDMLDRFAVESFDGKNWEENVHRLDKAQ